MISVGITFAMIAMIIMVFAGYMVYEIFYTIKVGTSEAHARILGTVLIVLAAVIVGLILYLMLRGLF